MTRRITKQTRRALMLDPTPPGLATAGFRRTFKGSWAKLRREHFATGNLGCEICQAVSEAPPNVPAHEVYSYPNPETIKLDAIQFLCGYCHDAIHFERIKFHAQPPYIRTLIDHYCRVNGVTEETFRRDIADTRKETRALVDFYGGANARPKMDYGPFAALAKAAVERRKLPHIQWRIIGNFIRSRALQPHIQEGEFVGLGIDAAENTDIVREYLEDDERVTLVRQITAGRTGAARALLGEVINRSWEVDEMLPDHECPEATAMWRDAFG